MYDAENDYDIGYSAEELEDEYYGRERDEPLTYDGDDDIDEEAFADPGGASALRAATRSNPRNLPCPQCGGEELLTPADVARHYVCDGCANMNERGW